MNGWEIKNLVALLENAQAGHRKELDAFIQAYPLSAVNEDYTKMVVFRKYQVTGDAHNRYIMNCEPEDDDYQNGIACVNLEEKITSLTKILVPNEYKYKSLQIEGDVVTIVTENFEKVTNMGEMLRSGFLVSEKDEIKDVFKNLKNERFKAREKPEVTIKEFCDPVLGILKYHEDYEWYEGQAKTNGKNVSLAIHFVPESELYELVEKLKVFIGSNAIDEARSKMVEDMYALKMESWIDDDEEITKETFASALTLTTVKMYEDGDVSMSFEDGYMFGGHLVDVQINGAGTYESAALVG